VKYLYKKEKEDREAIVVKVLRKIAVTVKMQKDTDKAIF